ncbi:MAG: 50S ribosomal protein L4 [Holosporales bacterium]|jgi:large subunit ribosomal protein L4|nr:50S ribosomal protein L4 [Holosporales bacterium]
MNIEVFDLERNRQGETVLSDELFAITPREDIVHRVVRWQLARRRAGTHQAKTISQVSGTGKKSVRQKGSGGARHGSLRGTQFRGGGIVFGPTPRSYEHSLPKRIRKLGLRMAVADKINSGELLVLDKFDLPLPRTKAFVELWKPTGIESALFVDEAVNENSLLALSNCPNFDVIPQIGLNVYDILRRDHLVMTVAAISALEARLHG